MTPLTPTPSAEATPARASENCIGIIKLDRITKRYEEAGVERTILHDVTMELGCGEFTVLLGRSGSGKSTLLNLIGGIDEPSAAKCSSMASRSPA